MKIQHITTLTLLARRFTHLTPRDIATLMRLDSQLGRLAVKQCNEPLTSSDEAKIKSLRDSVMETLKPCAVKCVEFSRDPRGVSFVIDPEDRNGNHFGGGWTFCL